MVSSRSVPRTRDAYFLLSKSEDGGLGWREVKCNGAPSQIKELLDGKGALVLYSELYRGYFAPPGVSDADLMRNVLTAPWVPRTADGVRIAIYMLNAGDCSYEVTQCPVSRYNLAGRLGQLLSDVGDAACKSGIAVAAIDAFLWLRNFLVNSGSCSVSPLYPVIGLLIGGLLYVLGLSLKCLFDRFYGTTPAAKIVDTEAPA